jgi:hypothetical protein
MQQGTIIKSEVYCETPEDCLGPFRTKGVECCHPESAYSCSHSCMIVTSKSFGTILSYFIYYIEDRMKQTNQTYGKVR